MNRLTGIGVAAFSALLLTACVDPMPKLEDAKPSSSAAEIATPAPKALLTEAAAAPADAAVKPDMEDWRKQYLAIMAPVGEAVQAIEPRLAAPRDVCNRVLAAAYDAQRDLGEASDPDIQKAVVIGLENVVHAGNNCLDRETVARDTHLGVAFAAFNLANQLARERYNLSLAVPGLDGFDRGAGALRVAEAAQTAELNDGLQVIQADAHVIEANSSWRRFAWEMTLRNTGDTTLVLSRLYVEFIDRDGSTIYEDIAYDVEVPAGGRRALSGETRIFMPSAATVTGIRAKAG